SNYGYAGEWTDTTGLQHLRARYMDPGTGRFISRDTWAGEYDDPMSLNKWMYVMGNPVMYTDPSGLYRWRKSSSPLENIIESTLEKLHGGPGGWNIHLEYPINTAFSNFRADLIFLPYAYDIGSSLYPQKGMVANIYEIEMYMREHSILEAK
ncbi:MAG: RHS repeat-associated core domain-containing protein, partial [Anaerolineae bacterium]|nr:RHS repeat-associated core domain-containing protein [Anaerolineae bacterium]